MTKMEEKQDFIELPHQMRHITQKTILFMVFLCFQLIGQWVMCGIFYFLSIIYIMSNYFVQTQPRQPKTAHKPDSRFKGIDMSLRDSKRSSKTKGSIKLTLSSSTRLSSKNSQKYSPELGPKCNQFCSFNFQQMEKECKSEMFFEGDNDAQNEENSLRLSQHFNNSCNQMNYSATSFRESSYFNQPPTPINKISNLDQEIEENKIKSKGIMIISSYPSHKKSGQNPQQVEKTRGYHKNKFFQSY